MNPLDISPDTMPSRTAWVGCAWFIAVVPSVLYFLALAGIGASAVPPPGRAFDVGFAAYSILVAPLLETALMVALARLLELMIPQRRLARVFLLAVICALAHGIGGTRHQVLASFWPFLVYSFVLVAWLPRSQGAAFVLTALVHSLYNATLFVAGTLLFLRAAAA
jgi:hypothetical protein